MIAVDVLVTLWLAPFVRFSKPTDAGPVTTPAPRPAETAVAVRHLRRPALTESPRRFRVRVAGTLRASATQDGQDERPHRTEGTAARRSRQAARGADEPARPARGRAREGGHGAQGPCRP